MRTRQPEATPASKTPAAAHTPETRTPRPANPLLALQRGYGNRFVQRLVGRGSTLDPVTRARLERAFGTDLSPVTIERRPEAATIGALAYTQGEHIALAPDQQLHSTEGQELLAHEVAHVVQQRQGRVQPQVGEFNVDSRLEAEADTVARRVSHGQPAGITGPGTPAPGDVAQGKFGFEFETGNYFIGANVDGEDIEIVGEKEIAFRDDQTGFKVEGDEGPDADHFDVEFITDATNDPEAAIESAEAASVLALAIARAARTTRYRSQRHHPVVLASGGFRNGTFRDTVAIEVVDLDFKATTQGSVGVSLDRIPELLEANLSTRETAKIARRVTAMEAAAPNLAAGSPELRGFLHILAFYVKRAAMPNERDANPPRRDPSWVKLPREKEWQQIVTDGPKANFAVMARTDFHSMYLALQQSDRTRFDAIATSRLPAIATALGRHNLDQPMFVDPYRADKGMALTRANRFQYDIVDGTENYTGHTVPIVTRSPSIREWLRSIQLGRGPEQKDLMSPPPGWGSVPAGTGFQPSTRQILANRVYGMGAYRMDPTGQPPLAVFELRGLGENVMRLDDSNIPATKWSRAVRTALLAFLHAGRSAQPQGATRARRMSM